MPELLRGVSRSFYLSIRLLPRSLREPVSVAYLLARATDTIADTATLPPNQRQAQLAALGAAIQGTAPPQPATQELAASFAPLQTARRERELIFALPHCLAWLDALQAEDTADIRRVLGYITRGQALDVERFGQGTELHALENAAQLDEYTYLVAGCVGEFWTDLCLRHLPDFATLPASQMRELGRAYGMGLQLVNILRDVAADLAALRCYLPADELAAAGLAPGDILGSHDGFGPVRARWLQQAQDKLALGMRYADAVNSRRVRAASVLPALIGTRTLALLRDAGPASLTPVKVPRREVRSILAGIAFSLAGRDSLQSRFARLGGMESKDEWDNPAA
ncbi:MAG: squalene/phytoene synthase family protein [Ramlibacter sp.]